MARLRGLFFLPSFLALAFLLGALNLAAQDERHSELRGSKHDLSVSGTGPVRSGLTDACVFCHGTHLPEPNEPGVPLWNKRIPSRSYEVYTSTSLDAVPGSVGSSSSKLCLSCHDGTIAPGQTMTKGTIATSGSMRNRRMAQALLVGDHPVGIQPVDDGQLEMSLFEDPPVTGDPAVRLRDGRIECVTCHSPHEPNRDPVVGQFLVRSNSDGALCLTCHTGDSPPPNRLHNWAASSHATSALTTPSRSAFGPYRTVAANACGNCHVSHETAAPVGSRLTRAREEDTCLRCHEGGELAPSLPDIGAELSKQYTHPIRGVTSVHDPVLDGVPVSNARHAECADCHNPHVAGAPAPAAPPAVGSALQGASGFDGVGAVVPAENEYQVCFKCHADSPNKPQTATGLGVYGWTPRRQSDAMVPDPFNTRLEFESPVSRHNVVSPRGGSGSNNLVPSLRPTIRLPDGAPGRSLTGTGHIYCSDCHNNDDARRLGGSSPNGPHGSDIEHLLAMAYPLNTAPAFSGGQMSVIYFVSGDVTYPLCNSCHYIDRNEHSDALLNDRTFGHSTHIGNAGASCSVCHDGHGIQGGSLGSNPSLVNFDLDRVAPLPGFVFPELRSTGSYTGTCYLVCHGVEHNGLPY